MMSNRDAYVEKMHAKLDEWNAEIDRLKAKLDGAKAEKRIEYREDIENLKAKQKEVEEKIDTLRDAGDDAWEDLKKGVEDAWQSMESAVNAAKNRFK
jgi:uncharacterized coiled-coil DUF342 family protein